MMSAIDLGKVQDNTSKTDRRFGLEDHAEFKPVIAAALHHLYVEHLDINCDTKDIRTFTQEEKCGELVKLVGELIRLLGVLAHVLCPPIRAPEQVSQNVRNQRVMQRAFYIIGGYIMLHCRYHKQMGLEEMNAGPGTVTRHLPPFLSRLFVTGWIVLRCVGARCAELGSAYRSRLPLYFLVAAYPGAKHIENGNMMGFDDSVFGAASFRSWFARSMVLYSDGLLRCNFAEFRQWMATSARGNIKMGVHGDVSEMLTLGFHHTVGTDMASYANSYQVAQGGPTEGEGKPLLRKWIIL
jgi:hypothetical protein